MYDEYTPEQRETIRRLDEGSLLRDAEGVAQFGADYLDRFHMWHYVLDEGSHVPRKATLGEWAVWLEVQRGKPYGGLRRVRRDTLPDGTWVSTVFLGLDHGFDPDGPPILFETMIFDSEDATSSDIDYQDRCSTWDEALKMHEHALHVATLRYEQNARTQRVKESQN